MSAPIALVSPVDPAKPAAGAQEGAPAAAPAQDRPSPAPSDARNAEASSKRWGDTIISGGRTLKVSYDGEIDRVIVTVVDSESGEVVRQIPAQDYLEFVSRFKELVGVLLHEKA